jgi:hypothetical protein
MPASLQHFAVLAPIPLEHLESGKPIAESTGYVAFGTNNWKLFQKLDTMRDGARVAVLIYPSWDDETVDKGPRVSWFGWYEGQTPSKGGAHPDGMTHRPPSTSAEHWAAFWHVSGLRQLPQAKQLPISKIETIKGGWRKNAPPRRPGLLRVTVLMHIYDGLPHPVTGNPNYDANAYTRVDANTLIFARFKAGKLIAVGTVVISPDGKTLTNNFTNNNTVLGSAPGSATGIGIAVYEKQ